MQEVAGQLRLLIDIIYVFSRPESVFFLGRSSPYHWQGLLARYEFPLDAYMDSTSDSGTFKKPDIVCSLKAGAQLGQKLQLIHR